MPKFSVPGAVGNYEIDDDPARIDPAAAVAFLTTGAYWGRWRTGPDIRRQIAAAWRLVGAYDPAGAMVGFARAFGDGGSAYLADVYVLPAHRGRGLGRAIVAMMIEEGPGAGYRWMLHTADAYGLYREFGFAAPPDNYMERPAGAVTVAGAGRPAVAGTGPLEGNHVRLEPLGLHHVPGLLAAAAQDPSLYRWVRHAPSRAGRARGAGQGDRGAVRGGPAGRRDGHRLDQVPPARLLARARAQRRAGHLRDRLHLAGPRGAAHRRQHRDEAADAHPCLRGVAGALGVPAHRRAEPAVTQRDPADRGDVRGRPARPPSHG